MVGLIRYFELKVKFMPIHTDVLGDFAPVVALVEE